VLIDITSDKPADKGDAADAAHCTSVSQVNKGSLNDNPRITGSVSPPEQERFLTDNEIIEHVMVRPHDETVNAVG
jgi:hypothetical protein